MSRRRLITQKHLEKVLHSQILPNFGGFLVAKLVAIYTIHRILGVIFSYLNG